MTDDMMSSVAPNFTLLTSSLTAGPFRPPLTVENFELPIGFLIISLLVVGGD